MSHTDFSGYGPLRLQLPLRRKIQYGQRQNQRASIFSFRYAQTSQTEHCFVTFPCDVTSPLVPPDDHAVIQRLPPVSQCVVQSNNVLLSVLYTGKRVYLSRKAKRRDDYENAACSLCNHTYDGHFRMALHLKPRLMTKQGPANRYLSGWISDIQMARLNSIRLTWSMARKFFFFGQWPCPGQKQSKSVRLRFAFLQIAKRSRRKRNQARLIKFQRETGKARQRQAFRSQASI